MANRIICATGSAFGERVIVGSVTPSLADSSLVCIGGRSTQNPQAGVHLGISGGEVEGVTVATYVTPQGAARGGEISFQLANNATYNGKIFYSQAGSLFQFHTGGAIQAILNGTGLILLPGNSGSSFPESNLVVAGSTPVQLTTYGVHLGQLPAGAGVCVRLVSDGTMPAGIDFTMRDFGAFGRGWIQYFFEPSNVDRMFFASDGAGVMGLSQKGCIIAPSLPSTMEAESALVVRGSRGDGNPGGAGLHFGMQGVDGDYANLALAARAGQFASRLDLTYAGQP